MRVNEGLKGLTAEQLRPVVVEEVTELPQFIYYPEAGEDSCRSFVGVPLPDQGMLVVQAREPRCTLQSRL